MSKGMKIRFGVVGIGSLAALIAVYIATGITGAYFSDTKQGDITGTTGSICIHTKGGTGANGLEFNFENLLPGEPQSKTMEYTNACGSKADVWVVFNNAEALHALNNLGSYGEVTISNPGGTVFHSANLNDNQPPASGYCGSVRYSTNEFSESGCWPLQKQYKVGSSINPGAGSYLRFTFAYASKLSNPAQEGLPWNTYPPEATPVGNGLPFQLVATQVGIEP